MPNRSRRLGRRVVTFLPLAVLIVVVPIALFGGDEDDLESVATSTTATPTETTAVATTSTNPAPSTSLPDGAEAAVVVSVTDGDTIRVDHAGGSDDPLRLVGINTPESGECFGPESTDALESLLSGQTVVMVSDVSDRDQFGRLLRYVYLSDSTFVNEVMVRQGYALAREYPPDTGQADLLASAQQQAEAERLGLWSPDACGAPADANLVITHVEADAPGDDHDNLNGEWVEITNQGSSTTDLTGWILKDESATHRYRFPDQFTISEDSVVSVHTGCGSDTTTTLYWCSPGAVWNNPGDTAFLLDPSGNIHDRYGW
jgi:micrococcal nuclease